MRHVLKILFYDLVHVSATPWDPKCLLMGCYAFPSCSISTGIYACLTKCRGETEFRINYLKCIIWLFLNQLNLSPIENLLIKRTNLPHMLISWE